MTDLLYTQAVTPDGDPVPVTEECGECGGLGRVEIVYDEGCMVDPYLSPRLSEWVDCPTCDGSGSVPAPWNFIHPGDEVETPNGIGTVYSIDDTSTPVYVEHLEDPESGMGIDFHPVDLTLVCGEPSAQRKALHPTLRWETP